MYCDNGQTLLFVICVVSITKKKKNPESRDSDRRY